LSRKTYGIDEVLARLAPRAKRPERSEGLRTVNCR
jgi:hypothetical protein